MHIPVMIVFYRAIASHFTNSSDDIVIDSFINQSIKKLHSGDVPVQVRDIGKFERMNHELSLRVNVLYMEGDDIYPIRTSHNFNGANVVNLALYNCLQAGKVVSHYSLVQCLDTFIRKTYRNDNGKKTYQKCHPCPNCFQKLSSPTLLKDHMNACLNNTPRRLEFPPEEKNIAFEHFVRKFKAPFIAFFDMESCCQDPHTSCFRSCQPNQCHHHSSTFKEQVAVSYSLIILDFKYEIVLQQHYAGYDCIVNLQQTLAIARQRIDIIVKDIIPMVLSVDDLIRFEQTQACHICERDFIRSDDIVVRDHCHLTGKFLGAAHNVCNLNRPEPRMVHIYCHNFSGYDSHLILIHLKLNQDCPTIECMALNTEKIRTLKLGNFIFLDSMSFLQGSLAELVNDLAKSGSQFRVLEQMGLAQDMNKHNFLLRKGVFPYEFASSIEKLKATTNMPVKEMFFNHLTDSMVSDEDYNHATKVFEEFSCCNMLDYMMLYMKLDTALLADVFINFRETMHDKFQLDPCQYISLPGYAYGCMMKLTGIHIDHIRDPDMFLLLAQNIRGGFSFIGQRLETDQTKSKTFVCNDRKQMIPSKRNNILYIDANNLYGWAQCQSLLIGEYQFLSCNEIDCLNVMDLGDHDDYGYIFEVDMEYPSSLRDAHQSFYR
ncbi:uncharacterized protein LOC131876988 isoform X1 [Tigriopus californicus]|uniref:uncharacterized protein LOC131876988 isoform X1 n=1 Tax=Tigriopus californicus TaxID=6832 RepID=UPI0027DAA78F|nr:uncharacterized protein LOC131876988 isoform X1 [Tigriopus californicus]